jgi:hypothetical protein
MGSAHSLTTAHALLGTQKIWKAPIIVYHGTTKNVQMVISLCKANVYAMKVTQKMIKIQTSVCQIVLMNALMAIVLLQTYALALMDTQKT